VGARGCESPRQVADEAEVVLLSLPTPEIVTRVATGPDGIAGGSTIEICVDLSTTGPAAERGLAQELAAAGIVLVDAPVSGGITGAESGTLTVMAACPASALAQVRALLEELAGRVLHVGEEPGMGQLTKVLNNLLSATALAATAEAVVLAVKCGLSADMLIDTLNASSGRNSATAQKFPDAVLPRTFDFGFALGLMTKDVRLALAESHAAGVDLQVGEAVAGLLAEALASNGEDADCTEIVKLLESRADVLISSRRGD
jgi:2-hydroxy-3-oxopropionate reductase